MKFTRALASALGILLFCNWIAAVMGFRLGMGLFANFKIEMPSVTLWCLSVIGTPLILPVFCFVALSSILLALRTQIGWWFALAVCLLCDVVCLGHGLPYIVLVNGLEGGDGNSPVPTSRPTMGDNGPLLLAVSFALTQLILFTLLLARRHLIQKRSQ